MRRNPRKISKQGIMNKHGKMTSSLEESKEVWKEYVKDLYDHQADHGTMILENEQDCDEESIGSRIEK